MKWERSKAKSAMPKLSVLAVALAFSSVVSLPVYADESPEQMKQRIEQLEGQVKHLQELVEQTMAKVNQAAEAASASADQQSQIDRLAVKVDAMDDAQESSGFKDLKISGMVDPTFIYNQAQDSSGFNFLNNFDGRDSNNAYAYDNSYFGQAMLEVDKGFEGGTQMKLVIAPHKSAQSAYNLGSIIHEASISVPTTDQNTLFIGGVMPDWSGYEYYFGSQNPLITHNLLFDFGAASYYTGAGMELIRGDWDVKAMLANLNMNSQQTRSSDTVLTYRGDYWVSEYTGVGFSGINGKAYGDRLDMFEVDGYYTRGDWNWQWQVGAGRWKNEAYDGDAKWAGASTLLSFNFTPRLTGIARLDYLKNDKNGGGTIGTYYGDCLDASGIAVSCDDSSSTGITAGDYRNGFGPTAADAIAYDAGTITTLKGANRSALSLGLDYLFTENVKFKAEYRFDHADRPVFYFVKDGNYKKNNQLFGVSTVVSF